MKRCFFLLPDKWISGEVLIYLESLYIGVSNCPTLFRVIDFIQRASLDLESKNHVVKVIETLKTDSVTLTLSPWVHQTPVVYNYCIVVPLRLRKRSHTGSLGLYTGMCCHTLDVLNMCVWHIYWDVLPYPPCVKYIVYQCLYNILRGIQLL